MHLMLIDPAPLEGGRTESLQFLQLADALAMVGARVTLVTPTTARPEDPAAILGRPVAPGLTCRQVADPRRQLSYRLLGLGRSNKPFLSSLKRWLRDNEQPVDAFYVRNLKLAEALLRQPGLPPVFFHAHEHFARVFAEDHGERAWRHRRKLAALKEREGFVYRNVAGIVSTVSCIVDDIRTDYGQDIPAVVVPNGVDLTAALATPDASPSAGADGRLIALYLGSLHPWKGVETVLRALPQTAAAVDLVIAGGNAQRVAELRQLAAGLGVEPRVRFLGAVPPAERFAVIAAADLALLPLTERSSMASRYTSPLKLFEYMAMGRAVLAADLPSVRDVVSDGREAVLVAPDQPPAWAAAMTALAGDAERRQRLGEAARRAAAGCGWPERAAQILDWLRQTTTRMQLQ